jgi:hypothetical protein
MGALFQDRLAGRRMKNSQPRSSSFKVEMLADAEDVI